MYPTVFEISFAIFVGAVSIALLAWFRRIGVAASVERMTGMMTRTWFQRVRAAASTRRMTGMITRIGLDPGIATSDDPRTGAIAKEMRRRCLKCPREDHCDKWLAGEAEGDNTFCPNAQTLGILTRTRARTTPKSRLPI